MTYIILPLKLIHVWFAIQGCTKGQKSGGEGQVVMRRAAAALRRLLICQNLVGGGSCPPAPRLVHP